MSVNKISKIQVFEWICIVNNSKIASIKYNREDKKINLHLSLTTNASSE